MEGSADLVTLVLELGRLVEHHESEVAETARSLRAVLRGFRSALPDVEGIIAASGRLDNEWTPRRRASELEADSHEHGTRKLREHHRLHSQGRQSVEAQWAAFERKRTTGSLLSIETEEGQAEQLEERRHEIPRQRRQSQSGKTNRRKHSISVSSATDEVSPEEPQKENDESKPSTNCALADKHRQSHGSHSHDEKSSTNCALADKHTQSHGSHGHDEMEIKRTSFVSFMKECGTTGQSPVKPTLPTLRLDAQALQAENLKSHVEAITEANTEGNFPNLPGNVREQSHDSCEGNDPGVCTQHCSNERSDQSLHEESAGVQLVSEATEYVIKATDTKKRTSHLLTSKLTDAPAVGTATLTNAVSPNPLSQFADSYRASERASSLPTSLSNEMPNGKYETATPEGRLSISSSLADQGSFREDDRCDSTTTTPRASISQPVFQSPLNMQYNGPMRAVRNMFDQDPGPGSPRRGSRKASRSVDLDLDSVSAATSSSSDNEEEGIKLLPCWERRPRKMSSVTPRGNGGRPSICSKMSDTSFQYLADNSVKQSRDLCAYARTNSVSDPMAFSLGSRCEEFFRPFVFHPVSRPRVVWDVLSLFFLFYDVLWIPLQAFGPQEHILTSILAWFVATFWTFDIVFSFLSGFNVDGVPELRPSKIARHYIRSWFFFDALMVSVEWLLRFIPAAGGASEETGAGAGASTQLLRLIRLSRLLRVVKAGSALMNMVDLIRSEFWLIIVGLAFRLLVIIVMSHFVACAWYAMGLVALEGRSWVNKYELPTRSLAYRYTTSLHWAMTQFTPASMEITPTNALERTYTLLVLMVAMVTFSSFVSSVTNATNRLQNLNSDRLQKMSVLRRYIAENRISRTLNARVWGCSYLALDKSARRLHAKDVGILSMIPIKVRADLAEEVLGPIVAHHPFFAQLGVSYNTLARKLLILAAEETSLGLGRELFLPGDPSERFYFFRSGHLRYNDVRTKTTTAISHGSWACEAVLWIAWKHTGQLSAETHCELLSLRAADVRDTLKRIQECQRYAREFVQFFEKHPDLLTDIFMGEEVLDNMVERAFTCVDECYEEEDSEHSFSMTSFFPSERGTAGAPGSHSPPLIPGRPRGRNSLEIPGLMLS
eukprot:TRINITY_DN1978_c0_g1_i3.p1 TRINITY_DN1978_c0_g1~~TRINITY_DN1978_c0_g1_i3.p1  ORF type:complete len:1118 (+),score=131.66 TRINITY_DN1978_c0_g1_i3:129-3482(+)